MHCRVLQSIELHHICKLWAISSERNLGVTCLTKCWLTLWILHSLTLIPYEFSYLHWQSPITVLGNVMWVVLCIMLLISSKRTKRSGPSYQRSCPYSRLFWLCQPQISSECAFCALRRVKSYLRTTMLNNRLNHLLTCTVHKELVKELNLKQVTYDLG